ncbi:MAG: ATP-grasp domain-containing protein [Methanobacterium sp.]|nr:ATP-grasp domain-containing protein [Methanobacterium sp.]
MENILVIGVNTRPMVRSLKNMGYNVYSVDYFGCQDINQCVVDKKSFLSQKPFNSCGFFSKQFDSQKLVNIAAEYMELADFIICCSGISPLKFPKHKLIGNRDVENIENKYKLYKYLSKNFDDIFKLPETYLVTDFHDAWEIAKSTNKNFLLKPLKGSGGLGIKNFDPTDRDVEIHEVLLQEIVEGVDISASVLSSGDETSTILTSKQLIGKSWLGQNEIYGYCGNIAPYIEKSKEIITLQKDFKEVSEDVIKKLKLIGSNGVDMIINNGNIYVIEVNARPQGTFEVAEQVLGINMAEAHINACKGVINNIPLPKNFAVKMIVHSKHRSLVPNFHMKNLNDIPSSNVIIEKGEPVVTVLTSGKLLENTIFSAKKIVSDVYQNLIPIS